MESFKTASTLRSKVRDLRDYTSIFCKEGYLFLKRSLRAARDSPFVELLSKINVIKIYKI